jgi:hypothetical protein
MNEPLPEPLEDFLNHPPSLAQDRATRDSILQKMSRQLQQARRPRWPMALAGAAAIALAFGSAYYVYVLRTMPVPEPQPRFVKEKDPTPDDTPVAPPEPKLILVKSIPHPRELENRAFDVEDESTRVRLYFQAGDQYLDRFEDVQSALRCYQQAIFFCDANDLEISPNDNWLVMALKRDQRKEK